MKKIFYNISLVKQDMQSCAQASAVQLLAYYGVNKTLEELKKEVPVYVDKKGVLLGSSLGHIAAYFLDLGFKTKIHTTDIQIFDPSWKGLSNKELLNNLKERQKHIKHPVYGENEFKAIFDGYISFIEKGGEIEISIIDEKYIYDLLSKGPVCAVVSYNLLNSYSKTSFNKEKNDFIPDSIVGNPATHAIVISGYEDGEFFITDPDMRFGGKRKISSGLLIASLYAAQTDYDSLLISIESKS